MAIQRWNPRRELSDREKRLISRTKSRKLLPFLRRYRSEILSDEFQAELESMYRDTGAGKEPISPGLMAMATLLQDYLGCHWPKLDRTSRRATSYPAAARAGPLKRAEHCDKVIPAPGRTCTSRSRKRVGGVNFMSSPCPPPTRFWMEPNGTEWNRAGRRSQQLQGGKE